MTACPLYARFANYLWQKTFNLKVTHLLKSKPHPQSATKAYWESKIELAVTLLNLEARMHAVLIDTPNQTNWFVISDVNCTTFPRPPSYILRCGHCWNFSQTPSFVKELRSYHHLISHHISTLRKNAMVNLSSPGAFSSRPSSFKWKRLATILESHNMLDLVSDLRYSSDLITYSSFNGVFTHSLSC